MLRTDSLKLYVVYKNKKILTVKNRNRQCSEEKLLNKHKKYREKKQQNIDKYQNKDRKHISHNKKYRSITTSNLQEEQPITERSTIQKPTSTTPASLFPIHKNRRMPFKKPRSLTTSYAKNQKKEKLDKRSIKRYHLNVVVLPCRKLTWRKNITNI